MGYEKTMERLGKVFPEAVALSEILTWPEAAGVFPDDLGDGPKEYLAHEPGHLYVIRDEAELTLWRKGNLHMHPSGLMYRPVSERRQCDCFGCADGKALLSIEARKTVGWDASELEALIAESDEANRKLILGEERNDRVDALSYGAVSVVAETPKGIADNPIAFELETWGSIKIL